MQASSGTAPSSQLLLLFFGQMGMSHEMTFVQLASTVVHFFSNPELF